MRSEYARKFDPTLNDMFKDFLAARLMVVQNQQSFIDHRLWNGDRISTCQLMV